MNPRIEAAVAAFRERERVTLLLDKKTQALSMSLFAIIHEGYTDEDLADYHRLTQKILDEYEVKREKAGLR